MQNYGEAANVCSTQLQLHQVLGTDVKTAVYTLIIGNLDSATKVIFSLKRMFPGFSYTTFFRPRRAECVHQLSLSTSAGLHILVRVKYICYKITGRKRSIYRIDIGN